MIVDSGNNASWVLIKILHNTDYAVYGCGRKVGMSHIAKLKCDTSLFEAGLGCGGGIGDHERTQAEPY